LLTLNKKIMNKLNRRAILISISFLFWMGVSVTQPVIKLFNNPSTFDYVVMLNNLFIVSAILIMTIPKAFKKGDKLEDLSLEDLGLKTGSKTTNPKSGCKSCKKKKK